MSTKQLLASISALVALVLLPVALLAASPASESPPRVLENLEPRAPLPLEEILSRDGLFAQDPIKVRDALADLHQNPGLDELPARGRTRVIQLATEPSRTRHLQSFALQVLRKAAWSRDKKLAPASTRKLERLVANPKLDAETTCQAILTYVAIRERPGGLTRVRELFATRKGPDADGLFHDGTGLGCALGELSEADPVVARSATAWLEEKKVTENVLGGVAYMLLHIGKSGGTDACAFAVDALAQAEQTARARDMNIGIRFVLMAIEACDADLPKRQVDACMAHTAWLESECDALVPPDERYGSPDHLRGAAAWSNALGTCLHEGPGLKDQATCQRVLSEHGTPAQQVRWALMAVRLQGSTAPHGALGLLTRQAKVASPRSESVAWTVMKKNHWYVEQVLAGQLLARRGRGDLLEKALGDARLHGPALVALLDLDPAEAIRRSEAIIVDLHQEPVPWLSAFRVLNSMTPSGKRRYPKPRLRTLLLRAMAKTDDEDSRAYGACALEALGYKEDAEPVLGKLHDVRRRHLCSGPQSVVRGQWRG